MKAMTVAQFGEMVGLKRSAAYALVAAREIDVVDVGTRGKPALRVTEEAIEAFLKRRKIPAKAA